MYQQNWKVLVEPMILGSVLSMRTLHDQIPLMLLKSHVSSFAKSTKPTQAISPLLFPGSMITKH